MDDLEIKIVRALHEQSSLDTVHVRDHVWSVVGQVDLFALAQSLLRQSEKDE